MPSDPSHPSTPSSSVPDSADHLRRINLLLETITAAHRLILDHQPPSRFCSVLLDGLCRVTDSEMGFIGETVFADNGQPFLKIHAITDISGDGTTRARFRSQHGDRMEFHSLHSLYGAVLTSNGPVISADPASDPRRGGTPDDHPVLNSFLGLPFSHHGKQMGMVGLANRPGGYDESICQWLKPALETCGLLIDAYRKREQRQQDTESLRVHEEQLRTLFDAMPDPVCFKDGEGRWLEANRAELELFRLLPADYRGKTSLELAERSPAHREAFLACAASDEAAWQHGALLHGEEEVPFTDGTRKTFDIHKIPLFHADGSRKGLVVLGRDITAAKQAEQQLHQAFAKLHRSEENLRKAQGIAHIGHWEWDIASGTLHWSEEIFRIFGVEPEAFTPSYDSFLDMVLPEDRKHVREAVNSSLTERSPYSIDHRIVRPNGEQRIVHEEGEIIRTEDGTPLRMLGTVQDITARKQFEAQLTVAANVFESSIEGITITDAEGTILSVNPAFSHITGYSAEEALGRNPNILKSDRHDDVFYKEMWETIHRTGQWQGEIWNRKKNGEVYPEWLTITAIKDPIGRVCNYVAVFHDMTDIRAYEEQLSYQSNHDGLTGLPNRMLLQDRLRVAMGHARHNHTKLAVLAIDLDNFKHVNDSLGHTTGDVLIQQVAQRLKGCVPEDSTVARLGGDDFSIILENLTKEEEAAQLAEAIIAAMAPPFQLAQHELFITVSVGITFFPTDGANPATLIQNAEMAMYRAKEEGKNKFRFFTKTLNAKVRTRLNMENNLRRALDRQEFLLYYQPKVDLASGAVTGCEALLRWQRPDFGLISPLDFIPLAEETGLIIPIGEWVLHTAAIQARAWHDSGHRLSIAVNISPRQFAQKGLLDMVETVIKESGLPPEYLELEVTESVVMDHPGEARTLMHSLREKGIRLSMDDFGTGYSSLQYLRQLPIDTLKVDRSFIKVIPKEDDGAAITATILSMAHSLNLKVVAEGVETVAQLDFLRAHACDVIQGYLFSPPLPEAAFTELLLAGKSLSE